MMIVNDMDWCTKVPGLRLNGHSAFVNQSDYWLPAMGNVDLDIEGMWPFKSTMSEAQAAVGEIILGRLDNLTAQRRERGLAFREALRDFPELHFQVIHTSEAHSHHLLPARYDGEKGRDALIRLLSKDYGIKAIVQYYPLNRYDLFQKTGYGYADVPETDNFFDKMVSFPFSLEISDSDFSYMIESVRKSLQRLRG